MPAMPLRLCSAVNSAGAVASRRHLQATFEAWDETPKEFEQAWLTTPVDVPAFTAMFVPAAAANGGCKGGLPPALSACSLETGAIAESCAVNLLETKPGDACGNDVVFVDGSEIVGECRENAAMVAEMSLPPMPRFLQRKHTGASAATAVAFEADAGAAAPGLRGAPGAASQLMSTTAIETKAVSTAPGVISVPYPRIGFTGDVCRSGTEGIAGGVGSDGSGDSGWGCNGGVTGTNGGKNSLGRAGGASSEEEDRAQGVIGEIRPTSISGGLPCHIEAAPAGGGNIGVSTGSDHGKSSLGLARDGRSINTSGKQASRAPRGANDAKLAVWRNLSNTAQLRAQFGKTKMCTFNMKNRCALGKMCSFAHSERELQKAPDLVKTKLCHGFINGGCMDSGCRFAHGQDELRWTNDSVKTRQFHWSTSVAKVGR
eukprot:TRINITY_DN26138_c0_g1_i1.p1 TRINITY_DN26138_c0_g1~~TRINITY_DN26138_c0_g1_i1.p1  ORF type:complete len:440 (-),score=62.02 TRINITY_DN26138_c0_g1_i1:69-1355(-)